jgi:hypothetical protein
VAESESEHSFSDTDAEAETLALGQLLLRKRSKSKLIDESYSRYSHHDLDDLPEWYLTQPLLIDTHHLSPAPVMHA